MPLHVANPEELISTLYAAQTIAESASTDSTTMPSHTIEVPTAKTPPEAMTTIPAKFLAKPLERNVKSRRSSRNEIRYAASWSSRPRERLMAITSTPTTENWSTKVGYPTTLPGSDSALPGHTTTAPKSPEPNASLPEVPGWALHIFAACGTFVLIVAIVLYCANFPPNLEWLHKLKNLKQQDYTKVHQEDDEHDEVLGAGSSAVAFAHDNDYGNSSGETPRRRSLRKRRAKNLSVDTAAEYRGLGIAIPGEESTPTTPKRRRSYDEESLRMRPESPIKAKWQSFTAPVPAVEDFIHKHNDSARFRKTPYPHGVSSDIETRLYPPSSNPSTPDMFDPYQLSGSSKNDTEVPSSALFRKVNGGISHVADRLSRTFFDQVTGPEEGLLLPVHSSERENAPMPGVFVG